MTTAKAIPAAATAAAVTVTNNSCRDRESAAESAVCRRSASFLRRKVRQSSGSPFCQARRAAGPVPGMDRSVSVIFSPRRHRLTPRLFKRNLSQMTSKIRTFGRTCDRFEEILPSPLPVAQPCILSLLFGCRTATKSLPKEAFHQGSVPLFWMAASKKSPMQAGRYLKYRGPSRKNVGDSAVV